MNRYFTGVSGDGAVTEGLDTVYHAIKEVGLNKECRNAGRISGASSVPAFLPSLFEISHLEQDCVLRIQGIELALWEELGDVEH